MYAIRRGLYDPLLDTDINDFVNPLQIIAKGYRGIFDPAARCTEKPADRFDKEFSRKVRIANRSFNGFLRVPAACNPLKYGRFAWQLVSHKLLRWFSPFLLCLHFLITLAVGSGGYTGSTASGFIFFYGTLAVLALAGVRNDRGRESVGSCFIPYYFVIMNIALATGILLRLRGTVISVWETVRGKTAHNLRAENLLPAILIGMLVSCLIKLSLIFGINQTIIIGIAYLVLSVIITSRLKPVWRKEAA